MAKIGLKANEVAINKSCSVKLDDETIAIVGLFYHTRNKDREGPEVKSWYRYEVRVAKVKDLEAEILEMKKPENRVKDWHWANPAWPKEWFMGYDKENTQAKGARFLEMKLKKAMDWDRYVALVKDGTKTLGSGIQKQYAGAQYACAEYQDAKGAKGLSILDQKTLLKHVGVPMWHELIMKRSLKA